MDSVFLNFGRQYTSFKNQSKNFWKQSTSDWNVQNCSYYSDIIGFLYTYKLYLEAKMLKSNQIKSIYCTAQYNIQNACVTCKMHASMWVRIPICQVHLIEQIRQDQTKTRIFWYEIHLSSSKVPVITFNCLSCQRDNECNIRTRVDLGKVSWKRKKLYYAIFDLEKAFDRVPKEVTRWASHHERAYLTHENRPLNWFDFAAWPALLGWLAHSKHTVAHMH